MNAVVRLLRSAKYLKSATKLSECPPDSGAEVAFAGRSNAGKSSALNVICEQKKLARTSKTPGRTQMINYFDLNESLRLVDLPGYGFAKVPVAMKKRWEKTLNQYFEKRASLKGVILMMDIRHPLTTFDNMMLEWASHYQMPLHILLTKADKLSRGQANNTLLSVRKSLAPFEELVSVQLFSSPKKAGLEEARAVLGEWLTQEEDYTEEETGEI